MSKVWDRILGLFRGRNERRKIESLMERRAKLTARRELVYSEVQRLERRERELLEQGRESESNAQKRRLAAQLAGLRKDLERRNTAAHVLNRNIEILSTHIHNLELIVTDSDAHAPGTEELNAMAVRVDEILAKIKEDSDLVAGIETDRSQELMSAEEADILAEFEKGKEAELASRQLNLEEAAVEPPRPEERAKSKPSFEKVEPAPAAERAAPAGSAPGPAPAKREEPARLTIPE